MEGHAFWQALQFRSPNLVIEACNCHAERPALERRQVNLKAEAVLSSRRWLFVPENESLYVRSLAESMGYVPPNLEVEVSGGLICVAGADLQNGGQWEGLQQASSNDGTK